MTCTKTGANIYIVPHRTFCYGDAFEIDGVAYFRIVQASFNPAGFEPIHYSVVNYDNWFDQGAKISTLISAHYFNHGYSGLPAKEVIP